MSSAKAKIVRHQNPEHRKQIAQAVGMAIKSYRTEHGMTQGALAQKIHVTQSYISKIESHSELPTLDVWVEFCDLAGLDPGDVFR